VVREEHISKQTVVDSGKDWDLIHLPTHRDHFYDVERVEFDTVVEIATANVCHVLMLVEGTSISVRVDNVEMTFNYAETFIVPAAASSYTLTNHGTSRAKVVKAFLKNDIKL
jgi:mannose-6-phosphate isomerase class I